MKNIALKFSSTILFFIILFSVFSQNVLDSIDINTSFQKTSKGGSKEEVEQFKKKVKKVQLVSYKGMTSLMNSTPNSFDKSSFSNQRTLKGIRKNKVLDLLYSDKTGNLQAFCYNPRNAIILYNSKGNVIGYIEICFECITMKCESDIPNLPQLNEEGYAELKSLYEKYGLLK